MVTCIWCQKPIDPQTARVFSGIGGAVIAYAHTERTTQPSCAQQLAAAWLRAHLPEKVA